MYPHWRGVLYPAGLAATGGRWLGRYASVFPTVELNNTFYKLPTPAAVDAWRDGTPPGFVFACKGSRFLTHMKRLLDTGTGLERYFALVDRLGPKRGPVLWQLPPQWTKPDPGRLDAFLAALPPGRHAVELRCPTWYSRETFDLLDRRGAALCEHDLVQVDAGWLRSRPFPRAAGFRYLRFHGAGAKYGGRYGAEALGPTARSLVGWRDRGVDAYVYFNNDQGGEAVRDALALAALVGQEYPEELRV